MENATNDNNISVYFSLPITHYLCVWLCLGDISMFTYGGEMLVSGDVVSAVCWQNVFQIIWAFLEFRHPHLKDLGAFPTGEPLWGQAKILSFLIIQSTFLQLLAAVFHQLFQLFNNTSGSCHMISCNKIIWYSISCHMLLCIPDPWVSPYFVLGTKTRV